MKIEFTHKFIKIYKKRFSHQSSFQKAFDKRARLFEQDHTRQLLKDHALSGKLKGYRAFSITGDVRVIYYVEDNIAYFIDIGTHNQVYK